MNPDSHTMTLASGVVLHAVDLVLFEREPLFACTDCVQFRAIILDARDGHVTFRTWHEAGCHALDYREPA